MRKVAYAQNLLSTVNVVLSSLRGDSHLNVSPLALVGERSAVREYSPRTVDYSELSQALRVLELKEEQRVLLVASLCRELGLRFREASLLNVHTALKQSERRAASISHTGPKVGAVSALIAGCQ